MRRSLLFSFALLFAVCRSGTAQDVVSASSGVLQYFEGIVVLDNQPIEHKAAVFPSLKNGSTMRTEKGRAELLLTPGVYLRVDENSSLRMVSNSLTDTRLELTAGVAILDNLNASSSNGVVLIVDGSEVRFPKQGVYRLDCDLGELQAYSGEAKVTHHGNAMGNASGNASAVDSSHLYYFRLELTTNKFGDGATDEFYDWAHNRSDVIADQNQTASAEQNDAADADPSMNSGMFVIPPAYSSGTYASPSTSVLGYSVYGSAIDPFYLYSATPYLGYAPFSSIIVVSPFGHRAGGSRWPAMGGLGYRPALGRTQWPMPTQGIVSHIPPPMTMHYPVGTSMPIGRRIGTTMPRMPAPSVAPHIAAPHGAVGHR
jgi:hypothetical protein